MKSRKWNLESDYSTLVRWWKQWEFGIVPKECLPPDGIIVESDDGTPICGGGLYIGVGTKFAFMEWVIVEEPEGDSGLRTRTAHKSLKMCIDAIMELARSKGMRLVYTATKEKGLHKRYVKYHNMTLTESDVKTFLRDLTSEKYKNLDWISDEEQIKKQHNTNK
jgi:hypothetical protein